MQERCNATHVQHNCNIEKDKEKELELEKKKEIESEKKIDSDKDLDQEEKNTPIKNKKFFRHFESV